MQRDARALGGPHRPRTDFVLAGLAAEFGAAGAAGAEVAAAAAERLDASAGAVLGRLRALAAAAAAAAGGAAVHKPQIEPLEARAAARLEAEFYAAFCRICRAYACRTHGGGHPLPRAGPLRAGAGAPRGAFGARPAAPAAPPPCGPDCARAAGVPLAPPPPPPPGVKAAAAAAAAERGPVAAAAAAAAAAAPVRRRASPPPAWSAAEDEALAQGARLFGADACRIAAWAGGARPCRDVAARLAAAPPPALARGGGADGAPPRKRRKGAAGAAAHRRRPPPAAALARARLLRRGGGRALWEAYAPCACAGPCRDGCPCAAGANFCEKFCACAAACANRHTGCSCKGRAAEGGAPAAARCASKQCPCRAAARECDPDLCGACAPTLAGEARAGAACANMRLRLGRGRRVLMGLSGVAGWGAFVGEPARAGDFIGEYAGELISHDEAERRGAVYDRDDNSYLFDLSAKWVVDARLRGNKLRFANHAAAPNCRPE